MTHVKTYLRSYRHVDGTMVVDELATFTEVQSRSHHSMYFDSDRGYRLADAEKLVAHWTFMGVEHGQTYRLHDLLRQAERDYEDALQRLRALGCEPNIYRMPANVGALLDVIQGGVETYEGFPLTTEHMGLLVGTINDIRIEIGHEPQESPLRRNGELV